jgi:siroheme synthase
MSVFATQAVGGIARNSAAAANAISPLSHLDSSHHVLAATAHSTERCSR